MDIAIKIHNIPMNQGSFRPCYWTAARLLTFWLRNSCRAEFAESQIDIDLVDEAALKLSWGTRVEGLQP